MADSFGQVLRRLRRAVGLTQEELAARAGLSVQGIGALERGERRFPHQGTVDLLIVALDLSGERRRLLQDAVPRRSRPGAEPGPAGPRQLPLAVDDFTGRQPELAVLTGLLAGAGERPAVVVAAVTGMGGVGKTALAVQVGHRVAELFPDGQLYLDLRGFGTDEPLSAPTAIGRLLRGLGTAPDGVPADLEDAIARYRSVLAGRRVLVVLDNASDVDQVVPLLPGTGGCAVLVTSRRVLTGLPAVRHVPLGVLSDSEGLELLRGIADAGRIDGEEPAARQVVRACGGLPLAIRLAGARLAGRAHWPVSHLSERLTGEYDRLDELEAGDRGVRASLLVSVRHLESSGDALDGAAARVFSLLGLLDGERIGLPVAARLADVAESRAERMMERLADANLLDAPAPGSYRFHDLTRVYAHEHAAALPAEDRLAALRRVLELYLSVGWRLRELSTTPNARSSWADEKWAAAAPALADSAAAFDWLDREGDHLPGLVERLAAFGTAAPCDLIAGLAVGIGRYYSSRAARWTWSRLLETVLELIGPHSDQRAFGWLTSDLGVSYGLTGRADEAVAALERAAEIFERLGDRRAELGVLGSMSHVLGVLRRTAAGIECGRRALAISHELGDLEQSGSALMALGVVHRQAGQPAESARCLTEAVDLLEQSSSEWRLANCLAELAELSQEAGRHTEAIGYFRRSIELTERIGWIVDTAESLYAIAGSYQALGRRDEAIHALDEALPLAEREGAPGSVADIRRLRQELAAGAVAEQPDH